MLKENYEILGFRSVFKNVHKNINVKLIAKKCFSFSCIFPCNFYEIIQDIDFLRFQTCCGICYKRNSLSSVYTTLHTDKLNWINIKLSGNRKSRESEL